MSRRNEIYDVILGFFLVMGINIAATMIIGTIAIIANYLKFYPLAALLIYEFFRIGLVQLLYVVPVIIWLSRQQLWGVMKGVIIGAIITALLNGGCWILVRSTFMIY